MSKRRGTAIEEVTMIHRVVLALLVFGLVACGDDGVSPEVTIIGTWEFVSITSDSGNATASGPSIVTFTETTATIASTDCIETGTYTLVDGTLTVTATAVNGPACGDMVGDVVVFQATVTSDTLTLVFEIFSTVTVVYRRVS